MSDIEKKLLELPKINSLMVIKGFDKNIEAEYNNEKISDSLGLIRFFLILFFAAYSVFCIIDIVTNPSGIHLSWILCLITLLVFIFTYINSIRKAIYSILSLYVLSAFIGIYFGMIVNKNISSVYFSGLIFIFIILYTGLRIRFIFSSITGIIIVISYGVLTYLMNKMIIIDSFLLLFINNCFILSIINAAGMLANYFLEYYMRHAFLLRKRIQYEEELKQRKVEQDLLIIKQERDVIKKLDLLKNDFIANVTHEIRTPLTLIMGPLESMLSNGHADDDRLKTIHYNSLKLLKLINNLLDFSKIDAGKNEIKKQKIKISKLLRFYVATVKSGTENHGLEIEYVDNAGESFSVNTDKNIIEKAVFNLISNSMKFTPKGGKIILQLDKRKKSFDISITDTGIGIPVDKKDEIFVRFRQLDNQISRKYEGTGIGLALTKELIESLGGKISVESKLGKGSTFTISLPDEIVGNEENDETGITEYFEINPYLLPVIENNNEMADGVDIHKNGKTILVVEDNHDMQKYINTLLSHKYYVNFAKNGKEGIEKAHKNKPDLILSDVMMPEMDGYRMTELIKSSEELKGIPVILLTAKSEMFMKIQGFNKGADDYIVKPFNSDELLARINAHLEIKKLRDQALRQNVELEKALKEKIIAQRQLEESEKRFREMAENLPVAIIENDQDNKITYHNKHANQLFDISLNDSLLDFIKPDVNNKFFNVISNIEKNEIIELCECRMKSANGTNLTGLVKSTMILERNKPKSMRSTIMEIDPNFNMTLMPGKDFYKKYHITERETEIIMLFIKGLSYNQISEKLFISYKTVNNHITNIYQKTEVNNRNQLVELIQKY